MIGKGLTNLSCPFVSLTLTYIALGNGYNILIIAQSSGFPLFYYLLWIWNLLSDGGVEE